VLHLQNQQVIQRLLEHSLTHSLSRIENSPHFTEPKGSLSCSRKSATDLCSEPSDSCPHAISLRLILISSSHLCSSVVQRWAMGRGQEFFSSPPCPDRLWVPPSLLFNGYQGAISLEVKRPRSENDHSPPYNAEVRHTWSYTSTPPVGLHGVMLS
jgi:hypothetical protein